MSRLHTLRDAALRLLNGSALSQVHELPSDLPEDEHVLWQGAPTAKLMTRSLHIRLAAIYLAVMVAWYGVHELTTAPALAGVLGIAKVAGLACLTLLIIAAYAWLVSRNTSYTLTNKRLVMQIGIALPMSFNIPFARIESASVKRRADGSGDIVVALAGSDRLGYPVIWPHARPWRFSRAQPMLRALPEVDRVARILTTLLAEHAEGASIVRGASSTAEARPGATYAPTPQAA
jgi:hypothetical protein